MGGDAAMTAAGTPSAEGRVAPLTSILDASLETYKWTKERVVNNKTIGHRVGPILDYTEETTMSVLKRAPIQEIVTAVDTRVEKAVVYGSDTVKSVREAPGKIKNNTLSSIHEKLNMLKVDQEETVVSSELLGVGTLAEDAKVITAERLSALLDASEGYLAQYLPISEEDRSQIKVESGKGELKPIAIRAGRQGKVAAKRIQEKALAKVSGIKERTSQVVHVDLVKYSEFLDKQKDNVKQTVYITMDKIDEKVVSPIKDKVSTATDTVRTRIINPAKERIVSVELPFKDRIVRVWTVVGNEYDQRVVQPRDQIVQMFREELALQQDIAKQQSGDDLTITAGLKAVVAAARLRLSKEWEVRISPALAKVMGRSTEYDEEEEKSYSEEKSYGDYDEDVSEGVADEVIDSE